MKSRSKPLEDYGVIGNLMSAALVARDGSIDWLCLPRFDSAPCFAALLGGPQHGRWVIAPAGPTSKVTRRYVPDTAVLETTFETETGAERSPTSCRLPRTRRTSMWCASFMAFVAKSPGHGTRSTLRLRAGSAVGATPRLRHERRRRTRRRGVAHAGVPRRARHEDPRGVLSP